MLSRLLPDFFWAGQALQILSFLVIVAFVCASLVSLTLRHGTCTARLLAAEGVLCKLLTTGLSLLCGT